MRTKRTAWVTENTANERSLITVGGTIAGAILYALVASSCGAAPDSEGLVIDSESLGAPTDATAATAIAPTVTAVLPADGAVVRSETVVRVVFSVAMAEGAEAAFSLSYSDRGVLGDSFWDTTRTVLAFRPADALALGDYALQVDTDAVAAGGTALAEPYVASFTVSAGSSQKN